MSTIINRYFLVLPSILFMVSCNQEPVKEICHVSTGGVEYSLPDLTQEDCKKEVQSYHDKGIVDAEMHWKSSEQ